MIRELQIGGTAEQQIVQDAKGGQVDGSVQSSLALSNSDSGGDQLEGYDVYGQSPFLLIVYNPGYDEHAAFV